MGRSPPLTQSSTADTFSEMCFWIYNGNLQDLQWAVARGFDLRTRSKKGNTLLHMAAKCRQGGIVEWLLQQELVDNKAVNNDWDTALTALFLEYPLPNTVSVDWVSSMILAGVPVNHRNRRGVTALFLAIAHRQDEAAEFLFQNGAEIAWKDEKGKTIVSYAQSEDARNLWDRRIREQEERRAMHQMVDLIVKAPPFDIQRRL